MTRDRLESLCGVMDAILELAKAHGSAGTGEGPFLVMLEGAGVPWAAARGAVDALVQTGHLSRDGHYCIRFVKELKRCEKPSKRGGAPGAASTLPSTQAPENPSATASIPSPTTEASTTAAATSSATQTQASNEPAPPEQECCGGASPSQFRDGHRSSDMASKKTSKKKPAPKTAKKGHGIKIVGETGVTEQVLDLARNVGSNPTKAPNPLKAKGGSKVVASKRRKPDVTDRAIAEADGPPPKKAKAPKPTKERKPSMLDAAAVVLAAEGELDCKAIIAEAAKRKLWESPAGKTPHATLYAAMQREISRKGKDARFVQTGPGKFAAAKGAKA